MNIFAKHVQLATRIHHVDVLARMGVKLTTALAR